jgi:hypothetical protein
MYRDVNRGNIYIKFETRNNNTCCYVIACSKKGIREFFKDVNSLKKRSQTFKYRQLLNINVR